MSNISPFIGKSFAFEEGDSLATDDVMLREPRLLVPGMQPLGLVNVDANNPLSKKLEYLFLARAGKPLYIYKNAFADPTGGAYLQGTGNGIFHNASGSSYFYPFGTGIVSCTGQKLSIVSRFFTRASVTTRQVVVGDWNSSGLAGSLSIEYSPYLLTSGSLGIQVAPTSTNSQRIELVSPAVSNTIYTAGLSTEGSGSPVVAYLNGRLIGATGNLDSAINSGTQVAIARAGAYTSLYLNGGVYFLAMWSRSLNQGEMCSVTIDPYQFLIPA